ncbi:MAG: Lrp/AsnC ligand binding domain-containing protein [Bacteroidota bacterium]
MEENYEFDNVDIGILTELMRNADKPYTEIARKVHVSPGTVHVRMHKMEEAGIVKGSTLIVDNAKLGLDLTAFLGIYLAKSSLYDKVLKQLIAIPEVSTIHYTTGNYNMFVRIHCRNTNHLKNLLHDRIQVIDGIVRTETIISLEESLHRNINILELLPSIKK